MKPSSLPYSIFAVIVISTLLLGAAVPQPAAASPSAQADGVRYDYSDATGALTFVGADPSQPVEVAGVSGVSALSAEDQALGIIDQYADALGLSNPSRELRLEKAESFDNRTMLRYQQVYEGIPVMGGDLILNTQGEGYLLSLSGEVSPDLAINTATQLTAEQASAIALQAMQKWYPDEQATFTTSGPELWIYDPRLLEDRDGPVVLGWRMEVTSEGIGLPIRELVLVDAKTGNVPLHFNQIDTGWNDRMQEPAPTDTPTETPLPTDTLEPTATPLPTETPFPTDTPVPTDVSTTEPTATEAPTEPPLETDNVVALTGTPRYVSTAGSDTGDCSSSAASCLTINYAIGQAIADDTIFVAVGTYTGGGTEVALIDRSLTLSGGWDGAFAAQNGVSTLDGQALRRGVSINANQTVTVDHFLITNGYTSANGGGMSIGSGANLTLNSSQVIGNSANAHWQSGGGISNAGTLTLNNSSIMGNTADYSGAGIHSYSGTVTVNSSSITGNMARDASSSGGGISSNGTLTVSNSTVSANTAGVGGGIRINGTLVLSHSTVSQNRARVGGGLYLFYAANSVMNSIVANNEGGSTPDCYGTIGSSHHDLIGNTSGCTVTAGVGDQFNIDPQLSTYPVEGGYYTLNASSPAIDTGDPATCLSPDQRGMSRPQGTACDIGAYEFEAAHVGVLIGATEMVGSPYDLFTGQSTRQSYVSVNNGPVQIASTNAVPLIGAERVIYTVNGVNTSFSEMMALPNSQLSTTYWLPFYNNVDLDTQLRFGNVSGATATVRVYIGGIEQTGCTSIPSKAYPYVLATSESVRVSCVGVSNGPVKIVSDQNIVAAERVIYKVNNINTSFSEMLALPNSLLDATYWLPWYNNVDLDTQLRFGVP
jgi:hypothetical protein